jgi:hypothetical protein
MSCFLNFNPSNPPEGVLHQVLQRRKSNKNKCSDGNTITKHKFKEQVTKVSNKDYAQIVRGNHSNHLKKRTAIQTELVSDMNVYNWKLVRTQKVYYHNNVIRSDIPEDTDELTDCIKKKQILLPNKFFPLQQQQQQQRFRRPVVIQSINENNGFRKRSGANFPMKNVPPPKPQGLLVTVGGRLMFNTYEDPCKI